jgi:hypothetical protein
MKSQRHSILFLTALLFAAFGVGAFFARPLGAQIGNATALKVATLPRLHELWRLTLDYPGATWEHVADETDQYGNLYSSWRLVFEIAGTGRLPVWTSTGPISSDYGVIDTQHYLGVSCSPSPFYRMGNNGDWHQISSDIGYGEKEAHDGMILNPGRYSVLVVFTSQFVSDPVTALHEYDLQVVAMSGYWAEP